MQLITRARIGYASALAAGIAIGLVAVGVASATPARPRPVTHHYSLAASAFAPDSIGTPADDYFNRWDPADLSSKLSERCFNAGLSLPTGVTLKSITFYFTRGDNSEYLELNRQNLKAHTFKLLAHFLTGTTSPKRYSHVTRFIARSDAGVDYTKYAYSAGVASMALPRSRG